MTIAMPVEPAANELLSNDPLALLIGMLLDQQVPLERAFSAPYDGPNSLPSNGQSRETWTTSLFLGVRLWRGGEFYFNPELLQGFGVADTTVRTHVNRLFEKTGATRQADLVKLVAGYTTPLAN